MRNVRFFLGFVGTAALVACSSSSPKPTSSTDSGAPMDSGVDTGVDSGMTSGDSFVPITDTGSPLDTGGPPPPWRALVGGGGLFGQSFNDVQWETRAVTTGDLYGVTCINHQIGWTVGAAGFVAHTVDAGQTWARVSGPLTSNLRTVHFGDASLGVMAGDAGALAVTSDGGAHWVAARVATSATLRSATVAPLAAMVLVVGDRGTMFRSDNAGVSWQSVSVPGAGDFRGVVSDVDGRDVFAVDSLGNVWSSPDGAHTFAREAIAPAALDAVALSDDASHAVAVGARGTVLTRTNAGGWAQVDAGTTTELRAAVVTVGNGRDYIAGDGGVLLTSVDEGAHWTLVPLGTQAPIYGLDDF